jgi:hypothetical protein
MKSSGKFLGLRKIKKTGNLGYCEKRNFAVYACHISLLKEMKEVTTGLRWRKQEMHSEFL